MNDKIATALKRQQMIPKSIYERPMTSAHEIGWYTKPLVTYILILYTNFFIFH